MLCGKIMNEIWISLFITEICLWDRLFSFLTCSNSYYLIPFNRFFPTYPNCNISHLPHTQSDYSNITAISEVFASWVVKLSIDTYYLRALETLDVLRLGTLITFNFYLEIAYSHLRRYSSTEELSRSHCPGLSWGTVMFINWYWSV